MDTLAQHLLKSFNKKQEEETGTARKDKSLFIECRKRSSPHVVTLNEVICTAKAQVHEEL